MAESNLNTRIMKALRGHHPVRVENPACPGTPDINYTHGWIESKWLPRWPTFGNVVKVDHFTPQQRAWHVERSVRGGVSYVVIQISKTVLLFRGYDAAMHLGKLDETETRRMALACWENMLPPHEFVAAVVME